MLRKEDKDNNLTCVCSTWSLQHILNYCASSIQQTKSSEFPQAHADHSRQEPGTQKAEHLEQVSPLLPAAVQLSLFTQQRRLQVVCTRPSPEYIYIYIAKLRENFPGREETSRSNGDTPMRCRGKTDLGR